MLRQCYINILHIYIIQYSYSRTWMLILIINCQFKTTVINWAILSKKKKGLQCILVALQIQSYSKLYSFPFSFLLTLPTKIGFQTSSSTQHFWNVLVHYWVCAPLLWKPCHQNQTIYPHYTITESVNIYVFIYTYIYIDICIYVYVNICMCIYCIYIYNWVISTVACTVHQNLTIVSVSLSVVDFFIAQRSVSVDCKYVYKGKMRF